MKYKTIYADPPWPQRTGKGKFPGADSVYSLMDFDEIKLMGDWIDEIADENSHLYMWAVSNYLQEALDTMKAWGYRYVTNVAWFKDRPGLGYYFKTKHELLLFGVKGSLAPKIKSHTHSTVQANRTGHSVKPDEFYPLIEKTSVGPYLELFARRKREGWHSWGNEVDCDISEDFGFWQPPLESAA